MTDKKCTGPDALKREPCPDFKHKPIDLKQFEGHTPKPWRIGASYPRIDWYQIVTPKVTFDNTSPETVMANATLMAAAPEMKDEIIELRAEVERLKDSDESMLRILLGDLSLDHTEAAVNRVNALRLIRKQISNMKRSESHAATLAGAADSVMIALFQRITPDINTLTGERNPMTLEQCHDKLAAALAAYRKTQGDGAKEVDHQARHKELHEHLDELLADFITHTKGMPSKNTILDLMRWSHEQTIAPSEIEGSDDNAKR